MDKAWTVEYEIGKLYQQQVGTWLAEDAQARWAPALPVVVSQASLLKNDIDTY